MAKEPDDPTRAYDAERGFAPADPQPSAPLPAAIGPYAIRSLLGEGGMGIVYEAEQQHPRRLVALKVVRAGYGASEERLRSFKREIETLARLKHPNIAAIYDAGCTERGEHFFTMELVRGPDLGTFLRQRQAAPSRAEIEFRLRLFLTICRAVSHAHQRGVIHRDLKPSNIIVAESEEPGSPTAIPQIKILDFGLARITESDVAATAITEVGVIKGTLAYMSPEQARGDPAEIDLRSDVYSLGVLLYEMLAGQRPHEFGSRSIVEIVRVICEEPTKSLAQSWTGTVAVDGDLETICGKALEKEADRRYASAAALADDVERFLGSQPILARPPSSAYQLRKFARRNRALVAGVAATVAVLIAGVVASTIFGLREAASRRLAEAAQRDTETVVAFQQEMLQGVDAAAMGNGLVGDLRENLRASRQERGDSQQAIDGALGDLQTLARDVNPTNVALAMIDRDILARALAAARSRFAAQPELAARLEHSIGATYVSLGMIEQAEPVLLAARERLVAAAGPRSPAALDVINELGNLYTRVGRLDEAQPLLESVLQARLETLGEDDPKTLQAMNDLAVMHVDAGQIDEAERLYRRVLEQMRRQFGEEDPRTLTTMSNYAWMLIDQGRLDEAEPLATRALELRRRLLGNDDPHTMESVTNLAILYKRSGRLDLAQPLYEEDYEVSRRNLGDEHPDLLASMSNLGRLYLALGELDRAEAILRKARDSAERNMPPDFIGLGIILQSYGSTLVALGRLTEAEPLLLRGYAITAPVLGEKQGGVVECVQTLVKLYEQRGQSAEAARWRERLPPAGS